MKLLRAVLFDAYGTLFDVYSVGVVAEQLYPGQGERVAQLWRDKQIEYTRLVSMAGGPGDNGGAVGSVHYQPFWDLTRGALRYTAERLGLGLPPANEARLMDAYRHLSTFPENRDVLLELRRLGVPAGTLSNGDPDMLGAVVQSAGFAELLDHVISVHPTRRYKTDPATYALGTAALGLPAHEILFVSSNCWDAIGATWFGYTTLWVNRGGLPLDPLGAAPSHTGRSLRDVLPLLAQPPSTTA